MSRPNNLLRIRFVNNIEHAVKEAASASGLDHPGLTGEAREIVLQELFTPVLPPEAAVGTEKITDHLGTLSNEIDVILYSRGILPPSMYDAKTGIFPIESVVYTIEIKSKLTAKTMADTIENARSVGKLRLLGTAHYVAGEKEESEQMAYPVPTLFAFASDLSRNGKSELERYKELDHSADGEHPALTAFCVIGRGYWYWHGRDGAGWGYAGPSEEYEEVLDFMEGVTDTIPHSLSVKGRPRFGGYIGSHRGFENA